MADDCSSDEDERRLPPVLFKRMRKTARLLRTKTPVLADRMRRACQHAASSSSDEDSEEERQAAARRRRPDRIKQEAALSKAYEFLCSKEEVLSPSTVDMPERQRQLWEEHKLVLQQFRQGQSPKQRLSFGSPTKGALEPHMELVE